MWNKKVWLIVASALFSLLAGPQVHGQSFCSASGAYSISEAENAFDQAAELYMETSPDFCVGDLWYICRDAKELAYIAYDNIAGRVTDAISQYQDCRHCQIRRREFERMIDVARALDALNTHMWKNARFDIGFPALEHHLLSRRKVPLCRVQPRSPSIPRGPSGRGANGQYVAWVHPDDRTCCLNMGNVIGRLSEAPYKYHGTKADRVKQGAAVLRRFSSESEMRDWVCRRRVTHMAYGPVKNHARIGDYDVTRLPCKAGDPGSPE